MSAAVVSAPRRSGTALVLVYAFILVGGALRSVEAGCQNSLKLAIKNPWLCGVISYAVAFTGFSIFLLISSKKPWPTWSDVKSLPKWAPFGGLLGGATILGMITVASSVGVSTFNALVIAGQMFIALVLDHYGLMGFERRTATPQRFAACGMIVLGIFLMAKY